MDDTGRSPLKLIGKNDAFLTAAHTADARPENSSGADSSLSQAPKIPKAVGDGRGGSEGSRCAYRSRYLEPQDRDDREALAAAVNACFSDALMTL